MMGVPTLKLVEASGDCKTEGVPRLRMAEAQKRTGFLTPRASFV